jgi:prevent-host-death family protein
MDLSVSAAEANRSFSRILQAVRSGQSYVITAHGKPVARISPCRAGDMARADARTALLRRLEAQSGSDIGPWNREELYER